MSRTRNREQEQQFSRARDELFSHVHRCGVLGASEEHQLEWIRETIEFLGERYAALGAAELDELKEIGTRFCRPVIERAEETSAADGASSADDEGADDEVAAA